MTDVVASARAARERLAQGLGALQGQGVPDPLISAAEPIARAMNALHRVEVTNGQSVTESGPLALEAVRTALGILQGQNVNHPSVEAALEAVAGSLGLVHRLVKLTSAPPPPSPASGNPNPAAQSPYGAPPQPQYAPQPQPQYAPQPQPQPQPQYAPQPQPQYAPQPQPQYAPQPQPQYAPMARQSPEVIAPADASFAPNSTLQSQGAERPPAGAQPYRADATQPEAKPLAAPTPLSGQLRMEAALGAHSATNFYKGLSGNDVVDAGGIFIATYQIPRIGTPLLLKISLPGGYEFDAQAIVRWTREPSSASDGASPGFGAQFTQISPDGRQLVYRYVRNREPLFHDDL